MTAEPRQAGLLEESVLPGVGVPEQALDVTVRLILGRLVVSVPFPVGANKSASHPWHKFPGVGDCLNCFDADPSPPNKP